MNTIPLSDQDPIDASAETSEAQAPVSRTMKLVIAGCITLGILDAYQDQKFFSDLPAPVANSHNK